MACHTPAVALADSGDPGPQTPFLELPDSVLMLIAAWLPSPDKKALRLACHALRTIVNGAVTSFLLTDTNLPLVAPSSDEHHQTISTAAASAPEANETAAGANASARAANHAAVRKPSARRHAPLHATFPNLTHLCLSLSAATSHEPRRAEQLRALLRTSLPTLHCLRVLDLSLACRDVALGRTAGDLYDTWALVVEGLPAGRPVRVLLHPPAALPAAPGCQHSVSFVADDAGATGGGVSCIGGATGDPSGGGASGGGGLLLTSMLGLLGARRPAAEVRLVTAPLSSKRYDKPRIPSYDELVAALTRRSLAQPMEGRAPGPAVGRCPALTGLVLGPESFDASAAAAAAATRQPATAAAAAQAAALAPWLIPNPLHRHAAQRQGQPPPQAPLPQQAAVNAVVGAAGVGAATANPGALRRPPQRLGARLAAATGAGDGGFADGGSLAWLTLLADAAVGIHSRSLEQLTLWESWPLAELLRGGGGGGGGGGRIAVQPAPVPACLMGLRRLVLSDQQAVLDRDRLSADALAPLAALPHLTRLELASLTINAAAAAAAGGGGGAGAAARRGGGRIGSGGAGRGGRRGVSRAGGAAAPKLPFTPLPQVLHLSVYHATRVVGSPDGDSGGGAAADGAWPGGGGPLAALFPRLRHLSASVTHGTPGRSASERWGYLAGLGSSLRSLHLRAGAAEDLGLQGRSEALASLTRVTALRLSADSGKLDGLRGLVRTLSCLGPSLAALRLVRLAPRQWGTDPRVAPLDLPRLTRLEFRSCSGDLVAGFDGVALGAPRLRRLEVRECDTMRPADLQWALERQMGLTQLVLRDVPGLASPAALAALRAARPALRVSICTTDAAEARALRRSRREARAEAEVTEAGATAAEAEAELPWGEARGGGGCRVGLRGGGDALLAAGWTADDFDEL